VTSRLPVEVQEVFDRFITTEYTTIDSRGQPIAWPVTPYYKSGDATIDVTTGSVIRRRPDARRRPAGRLLSPTPRLEDREQRPGAPHGTARSTTAT
jgi:hypothetical protein